MIIKENEILRDNLFKFHQHNPTSQQFYNLMKNEMKLLKKPTPRMQELTILVSFTNGTEISNEKCDLKISVHNMFKHFKKSKHY